MRCSAKWTTRTRCASRHGGVRRRLHLAMEYDDGIHLGGSSWKSLRMKCRSAGETNEELVTYIHPQSDDEMRRWLR